MLTVETVKKFEKIVRAGLESDFSDKMGMNPYFLFYIINNRVDIHKWMDGLNDVEKQLFSRTMYELSCTYSNFKIMDQIRNFASNLEVCDYVYISQMKEKLGTIRIYSDRSELFYEKINNDSPDCPQIMKSCEVFDIYVSDMEDYATNLHQFSRTIRRLSDSQYNFSHTQEKTMVGIRAMNYGLFSQCNITPNEIHMFALEDGVNEIESSGYAPNSHESMPVDAEIFDRITRVINEMMPR